MPGRLRNPPPTFQSIAFLLGCTLVVTTTAVGQALIETGDAGMLPINAQEATSTAITSIAGSIADSSDVDMFKITIDDPDNFTATTDGTGGNLNDSRLFLFDADGRGVYFNDDASTSNVRSTLPQHGDSLGPMVPGDYYLAISGYPKAPTDVDDVLIFLDPDSGDVSFDAIVPPSPETNEPIGAWIFTASSDTGTYEIVVTGVNGTLSATFADVRVQMDGGDTIVLWSTAAEVETSGFVVETRSTGTAGFTSRGFVAARGAGWQYRYRVDELPPGPTDVRVRAVGHNGSSSISPIIAIDIQTSADYVLSDVFPNPFRTSAEFTVVVDRPQRVRVHVHNVLGQRVSTLLDEIIQENVIQRVDLDGSDLPTGIYMVSVRGEHFNETRVVTRLE